MYKKLSELKLINHKIELQKEDTNTIKMDSQFNYLITDDEFFNQKDYETNNEYKFRVNYYKFIINNIDLKGDIPKILVYMQINRIKLNTIYDSNYEKILNKIEQLYIQKNKL